MRKNKFNALLAAGCLALLAPGMANAADWGAITIDASSTDDERFKDATADSTFNTITVTGSHTTDTDLRLNASEGDISVNDTATGVVSLTGDATNPAILDLYANTDKTIGFTSTNATGTVTINQVSSTAATPVASAGTSNIGATTVYNNATLTLNNASGGTLQAGATSLGDAKAPATTTGNASLVLSGDKNITVGDVTVNGTGNRISSTNNNATVSKIIVGTDNAAVTLVNVGKTAGTTHSTDIDLNGKKNVTLTLNNSNINNDIAEFTGTSATERNTLTVKADTTNTSAISLKNVVVGSYGTLDLQNSGGTGSALNTGTVALNGNANLNFTGANTIQVAGINYANTGNSVNLNNAKVKITSTYNEAGTAPNINFTGTNTLDISGGGKVGDINLTTSDAAKTLELISNSTTEVGKITLQGSEGKTSSLTLTNNNELTVTGTGDNKPTLAGYSSLALAGTHAIGNIAEVNVSGASNTISANDTNKNVIQKVVLSGTNSGLTLNNTALATGIDVSGTSTITAGTGANLGTVNYNAATVTASGLAADNHTNGTFTGTNAVTLNNSAFGNFALDASTEKLTLTKGDGTNSFGEATLTSGSELITGVNGTKVNLTGSTLTVNNATLSTGVDVAGTSTITAETGANLGTVNYNAATLTASGLTATNHTNGTFTGANAVTLNNSAFGNFALDAGTEKLTLTKGDGTNSFGTATLTNGSELITSVNGTKVNLTGSKLTVNGATLSTGVDVAGTSTITAGTGANLGTVNYNAATVTASGLAADNHTNGTFTGANTVKLATNNSEFGGATVSGSGNSLILQRNADTVTGSSFTTVNVSNGASFENKTGVTGTKVVLDGGNYTSNDALTGVEGVGVEVKGNSSVTANAGANLKQIKFTDAGTLDVSGLDATATSGNFTGFDFNGNNATVNDIGSSKLGEIKDLVSGQTVTIKNTTPAAVDDTINTEFTTANLANGSTLTLNASTGNTIKGTGAITMNGNNTLNLQGAGTIQLANAVASSIGVDVKNRGNSIVNDAAGTRNLGVIHTNAGSSLYIENLQKDRDFTDITGSGDIVDRDTDFGNIDVNDITGDKTYIEVGTGRFDNVTIGAGHSLTLNTQKETTTSTSVGAWSQRAQSGTPLANNVITMNGGTTETTDAILNFNSNYSATSDVAAGTGAITLNGDGIKLNAGGYNTVNNYGTSNIDLKTITYQGASTFNANAENTGTLTYNVAKANGNLNTTGTNNITELATDATASTVDTFTLTSTDTTGITTATVNDGDTLNLNAVGNTGSTGTVTVGKIVLNNAVVNLNNEDSATTPHKGLVQIANVDVNDGENNVIENKGTATQSIGGAVTFNNGTTPSTQPITLEVKNINSITSVNQNGTNTLVTSGGGSIGTLALDGTAGATFTLNTLDGTENIATITRDLNPINVTFNAAEGATINANTASADPVDLALASGDSLTLLGKGNINLNANVTVTGTGSKITSINDNASLGNLTIGSTGSTVATLDTSDNAIDVSKTVDTLHVNNLTINDNSNWNLDFDQKNKVADKIKVAEGGSATGTMDFEFTNIINPATSESNTFVKYVQLIDGVDNEVLNSTWSVSEEKRIIQKNNLYYSYVTDADRVENEGSYAPNTVRITDYNISGNLIADYITQQGERVYQVDYNPSEKRELKVTYGAGTEGLPIEALPNMQARAGVDNVFTFSSNGYLTGWNANEDTQAQLFTIDTTDVETDKADRTLNLNDMVIHHAVSDTTYSAAQRGKGSVLYVNSVDDSGELGGVATVNINTVPIDRGGIVTTTNPEIRENYSQLAGGAIYNNGANSNINSNRTTNLIVRGNRSGGNGGAIYNDNEAKINLAGNNTFKDNVAGLTRRLETETIIDPDTGEEKNVTVAYWDRSVGHGGGLYNANGATVTLGTEKGDKSTKGSFIHNEAFGNGGASASVNNAINYLGNWTFKNNVAAGYTDTGKFVPGKGGAISATAGSKVNLTGSQEFINNAATGKGGAIYASDKGTVVNITANRNTYFNGNRQNVSLASAGKSSDVRYWTDITADTGIIKDVDASDGHKVLDDKFYAKGTPRHVYSNEGESNAIFLEKNATVNLATNNGATIAFGDKLASDTTGNLNQLPGSQVFYNTDMSGFQGNFNLGRSADAYFTYPEAVPFQNANWKFGADSGLYMLNGKVIPVVARGIDMTDTVIAPMKMTVDLNLSDDLPGGKQADRFITGTSTTGNVNITAINAMGVSKDSEIFYPIAQGANFTSDVKEINDSYYKYNVQGANSGLWLRRGDLADTSLLGPQIAANAKLAAQLDLYNNILHRVDEIAENRYFHKVQRTNLYAGDPDVKDDRRIDNGYTPYVNQQDGGNIWVKPNFTIEHITPEGYHGYENKSYNAFVGYEMPVATMKNNWDLISTIFGGYQGSYQNWDNSNNWQNGGAGGYMANLYHKNFFAGGVVMMGGTAVNVNDSGSFNRNMDFGLFDVGGGVRAGYNVGLGKHWLLQPMATASYIYVSGVNKHNGKGESIEMDGTHAFQLAPGFKIIGNYGGWKPYALCDYTWPIGAKTRATVNDIDMPTLRLKSYFEYGIGIRKDVGDRFTGHVETVFRNGGRTGVTFQGGLLFRF